MNEAKTNLTLKQRQRLQGKGQSQKSGDEAMNRLGGKAAQRLVLLLAFLLGVGLGMIYSRPDPALQELDDMAAILGDENTPNDVRGGEFRQLVANDLPANLRRGRGMRGGDPDERDMIMAPKFLTLSAADQLARLKAEIDWQKEQEARWAERAAEAAANAPANPAGSSQAGNSGNNSNSKGGGRGGKNDQQRMQAKEQMLANHQPQQRAQGGLMSQMRNAVRQASAAAR